MKVERPGSNQGPLDRDCNHYAITRHVVTCFLGQTITASREVMFYCKLFKRAACFSAIARSWRWKDVRSKSKATRCKTFITGSQNKQWTYNHTI